MTIGNIFSLISYIILIAISIYILIYFFKNENLKIKNNETLERCERIRLGYLSQEKVLEKRELELKNLKIKFENLTQKNKSILSQAKKLENESNDKIKNLSIEKQRLLGLVDEKNKEIIKLNQDFLSQKNANLPLKNELNLTLEKVKNLEFETENLQKEIENLRLKQVNFLEEKARFESQKDSNNLILADEILDILEKNSINKAYEFLKAKYNLKISLSKFTRDTRKIRNLTKNEKG